MVKKMNAPASKRQKTAADDAFSLGPDRGDDSGPVSPWTNLPVTAWGHALDYLRYSEARNALLVSKTIASDVPKHVLTLNIFAAAEMHARTARRFPNCIELNILFFLVQDEEDPDNMSILIEDVAHRVVPFLPFFLKLKNVFVGGVWKDDDEVEDSPAVEYTTHFPYSRHGCSSPDNHDSLYRYLEGIDFGKAICCTEDACVCRKVSKSFPFGAVIPSESSNFNDYSFTMDLRDDGSFNCIPINERIDIIKERAGGLEYLRTLTPNLESCLSGFNCAAKSVPPKQGVECVEVVHYLDEILIQGIERLVECGCDPSELARERVVDRLQLYRSRKNEGRDIVYDDFVARATFDRLVAWGFPVEEGDFRIIGAIPPPSMIRMPPRCSDRYLQ